MSSVVLLCGRSFSGKSTIARGIAAELLATIVSLDEINERRNLNGGDGISLEEWQHTHGVATVEARRALRSDRDVIIDDTGSPRFLRDGWRELATREKASFTLVYVDASLDELRGRLAANRADPTRHDITDEVFEEHLAAFEPPDADEDFLVAPDVAVIPEWVQTTLLPVMAAQ
jgi:predicted kinase